MRGDKANPVSRGKLCRKCSAAYNGVLLDPDARLARPLRRRGAKGQGRFEAISWEAAIGEITERLQAIVAESGGAAVLNTHYTGTFAMIGYHFPMRFFNRLGATEVDPDTVCNKAGHVALEYVYGTSLDGFDPRTAADSACILVWGANPSASAPHQHEYWLAEAACPVVVVDPLRTATAKQADLHLQLRPGTDAVLAFALLHVLCRDGLIDREFLAAHSVGFDELESEIARCEPDRATAVTGVPAGLVEQAAHLYGAGPSLLWIGQGLQRQPTGGNVVRSVAMLPAVTGSLGRPGGGFLYLNGIETRSLDSDYLLGSTLAAAPPAPISQMDLASALEEADRFRALFCWNINIAASNPEQRRLKAAMQRESLFTVVVDLFQTDTADLADIVLPASSFLEHDDLVVSYFHHSLGAQVKALEPPGEALPNSEIFRRLARAMGYEEPELFESDEDVLARLLSDAGIGITFEELARGGTLWPEPQPRLQFADGRYPTPSGRIEIASERAEADGFSRIPLAQADSAAERRSPTPLVAGLELDAQRQLRKRPRRQVPRRCPGGHAQPERCSRSGPSRRRRRPPALRNRRAARSRLDERRRAHLGGSRLQGPLAQARTERQQRQRLEPGAQVRHGRELGRARHRGDGGAGRRPSDGAGARRRVVIRRADGDGCGPPRAAVRPLPFDEARTSLVNKVEPGERSLWAANAALCSE